MYKLGEKVFLTVEGLQEGEKGKAIFLRPINATHMTAHSSIPFDGKLKTEFNQYVEPKLLKSMKTCSVEDVVGEQEVWFKGTNYESLKFQMSGETIVEKIVDCNQYVKGHAEKIIKIELFTPIITFSSFYHHFKMIRL